MINKTNLCLRLVECLISDVSNYCLKIFKKYFYLIINLKLNDCSLANASDYFKFRKYLEILKIYLIWSRFSIKDYWLLFDFIITFLSNYTIDDFLDILSLD